MSIEKEHASIMLKRIFDTGVHSEEITLISGKDNQRIPIHRNILTAASKYFTTLLGLNLSDESVQSELVLYETDGDSVRVIVDFCYTGHINLTEKNAETFLSIAQSFEFDLLERECLRFYAGQLSVNNFEDTLLIADKFNNAELREHVINFLCECFESVSLTDVQRLGFSSLHRLLECEKIQATEELIFKRVMEWFQKDQADRKKYMNQLLKLIRLQHVAQEYLENTVDKAYETFNCSELVLDEYKRRSSDKCLNMGAQRCRSILSIFTQYKGVEGANYSAVKVEKYNNTLKKFEASAEIMFGDSTSIEKVLCKNKVYIMGDIDSLSSMFSYDLVTRQKENLPEMNFARRHCTSIVFGKYIYVLGGYWGSRILNSCERFDTETNTWSMIEPMKTARYHATATILNEYICIAGGRSYDRNNVLSVELYDPKSDEWRKLAVLNKPRSRFSLIQWNGFLYAIGGNGCVEKYDSWKNCWTKIGSFNESHLVTSAIIVDGEIVVIMGNGRFGKVKIDENDKCSFVSLGKSDYATDFMGFHSLFLN